jgi:HAD superfamily hydrolase (TIGR01509 family)
LAHPPVEFEAVWARHPVKRQLFLAKLRQKPFFLPEVPALIKSLTSYKLGVVSASSRIEIEAGLNAAGILHCFEVVIGTEDVERTKPDPEPYLLAMQRLGARKALAVEDSEAGVASAKAAGLDVLRVPSPGDMPELLKRRLDYFR